MSTKEYGCFFCDGKALNYDDICPECGHPIDIGNYLLERNIGEFKPLSVIGRGFYGWMIKMEAGYQQFAVKILPQRKSKKVLLAKLKDGP